MDAMVTIHELVIEENLLDGPSTRVIVEFFNEQMVPAKGKHVLMSDLYQAYKNICVMQNLERSLVYGKHAFRQVLREIGCVIIRAGQDHSLLGFEMTPDAQRLSVLSETQMHRMIEKENWLKDQREAETWFENFLEGNVVVSDDKTKINQNAIYQAYKNWCDRKDYPRLPRESFYLEMCKQGHIRKRTFSDGIYYVGIQMRGLNHNG